MNLVGNVAFHPKRKRAYFQDFQTCGMRCSSPEVLRGQPTGPNQAPPAIAQALTTPYSTSATPCAANTAPSPPPAQRQPAAGDGHRQTYDVADHGPEQAPCPL